LRESTAQPAPPALSTWRVDGLTTTQTLLNLKYLVQIVGELLLQAPPLQRPEHVAELSLLLQEMLIVAVRKSGTLSDDVAKLPPGASVAGTVTGEPPGLTYEKGRPVEAVPAHRLVVFGVERLALSGP